MTGTDNTMTADDQGLRHAGPNRLRRAAILAVVLALVAAACGGGDDETAGGSSPLADLADLTRCPDPLVIQTDWFPQPEHGAVFNLTAGQGRINAETGRFRGPLAADPEITVEVRAGGPFLGTDSALDVMVDNDEVFLAYVNTDEAIARYQRHPTTAVVAPLDINPQILMWDPEVYTIEGWQDVADTEAVINHFPGVTYIDYLVDADLVDPDQLDDSYDGSPERFIARDGSMIQQGFVTQEPYAYENVLAEWGRPVESLLIHDAGYEIYQGALTVLDDRLDAGARACLAALVPVIQQSIVDFQQDPATTNDLLIGAVDDLDSFWRLTEDGVLATVIEMGSSEIVGNGGNTTIGDFDIDRVTGVLTLLNEQVDSIDVPSDLQADDLVTNDFIDPDIGL